MTHTYAQSNQTFVTVGTGLLIGGAATLGLEIAAFEYQKRNFGEEIDYFPAAAGLGVTIGVLCLLAAVICLVMAATGRKSRAYLDEISHPRGGWEENEKFIRRLSAIRAVSLFLPILLSAGILVPYINHNNNIHEANMAKRWAVVRELDEVFPGLRSTYSDREINAPKYDTVGLYFDYGRDSESEFDPYGFSVKMDYTGKIIEIEYELYSLDGKKVPTLDDLNAFVSEVGKGLEQCGSVDSAFSTPIPDRAVTRAKAEALKNGLESGCGQGWTMENGVACAYTCANKYTWYEVSTDENAIEIAEFDDKQAAKAENE